jgi:hypothetical protein
MENEDAAQPIGGTSLGALLTAMVPKSASVLSECANGDRGPFSRLTPWIDTIPAAGTVQETS